MRTHAEPTFDDYGPFSMAGPDPCVSDHEVDGITIIDPARPSAGNLAVDAFLDRIQKLLDRGKRYFAINLADVSFVDSCGLGALMAAYKLIRQAGGQMKFFAVPERLVHTFERLHLETVFELYADEASALSSF